MEKKVAFLDLRIDKDEREELLTAINTVFEHGKIVLGPEVQEFERLIANFCNRKYAVGVSSGSDALFLGLKSLGIKEGDEVITTSLSWIATAHAIARTGAKPIFADINDDLNIDPDSIIKLVTSKTKAIVPVHYTGKICQMNKILDIAKKHNLHIVEDSAQAFGALYEDKIAGSFGKVACFSLNPMKVFAACGEAGIVLTDDKDIYEKLIILRYSGTINKEQCIEISLNSRIDTIQAAMLIKRFDRVKNIIEKRRRSAQFYNDQLKDIVKVPIEKNEEKDVYYTYTIQAEKRNELQSFLESKGIETKIQHPYLMPDQPVYINEVQNNFPKAKNLIKKILCLPIHEKLTQNELKYVVDSIKEFYAINR
ncbi:MAG: DegT/DnrJ/EryC1/StrS family aminotransferase [Parachlamydiales bacterium]